MRKVLLTFLALAIVLFCNAQERTVSGKVSSTEDGTPLPGVNVILKGTTSGTATDADGNYSLSVPANGGSLVFSFIGLESKEIEIGDRTTINISMALDVTQLSEVVVVGYGTQSKRELTGSVASIKGSDISQAPVQSFDQALQGRAAGVNIITPNGVLNNPPVIRIRGVNSINLSSYPLIVIDGVPTFTGDNSTNSAANNPLGNLNPADIESIEILKDASASAIYGSRASAGVILVTTKRGVKGKARVNYDGWMSFTKPFKLFDLLNANEYMMIKNEARVNNGQAEAFFPTMDANGKLIDTDWYDYVYQTGVSHSSTLSFSGGSETTTYYLSVGYSAQEGMLKKNEFERTIAKLNLDHKVFDRFKVGVDMTFGNGKGSAPNTGSLNGQAFNTGGLGRLPLVTAPNVGPYLLDGTYSTNGANIGTMSNTEQSGFYNPVIILDKDSYSSNGSQIQGTVYANWEVLKNLNLRTTYGINRFYIEDKSYQGPLNGDGFSPGGSATNVFRNQHRWNWQNTLQYDFNFSEKHNFSVLAGGEQQYSSDERWGANRTTLSDNFFESFQGNFANITPIFNLQSENYLISYFGRMNYNFNKKYFATVNYRRDGYSAFAEGKKYGDFYGASLGYTLSEEEFWKSASVSNTINYVKFRASYGVVGNNQGIPDYASLSLYNSSLYGAAYTINLNQIGSTNLSWETSKKTDIGLTFGLWQDRIQGEIVYYNNLIDGMILYVPQSPSKGIPGNVAVGLPINVLPANIGSMENKGIEISLNATAYEANDFSWKVSANFTTLKNEVLELNSESAEIRQATSGLETVNITKVGEPIGSLVVVQTAGVNPVNGRRIFVKADGTMVQYDHSAPAASRWTRVDDGTPTTAPNSIADGKVYGPTLPTWYGGFDNTFKYKNIDLGIFFQFSGGNYIYNGTKAGLRDMRFWNNHTDVLDRWTPENTSGKIPRVVYTDNVSNGSSFPISENVEKGDFIRLRSVSLGYTLNRNLLDKLKISNIRVYGQVQNAFIITDYEGIDPEISTNGNTSLAPGIDRNSVGQARTFTVGLNVGF